MGILYGLLSALSWGSGDFAGGFATKRSSVYSVVIASQLFGITLIILVCLALDEPIPTSRDFALGGAAGMAGSFGVAILYYMLAQGQMGITAPLTAITTALLPVIFSAMVEGLPDTLPLIGFGLALFGVWCVSKPDNITTTFRWNTILLPLLAGAGFGLFLILIERANQISALWPLVSARASSLTLMFMIATFWRQQRLPDASNLPVIFVSGALDTGGNAFFALAAQAGSLDEASVVSSLYPAVTVLLAFLLLKEHISRLQGVGIGALMVAIFLIAL